MPIKENASACVGQEDNYTKSIVSANDATVTSSLRRSWQQREPSRIGETGVMKKMKRKR